MTSRHLYADLRRWTRRALLVLAVLLCLALACVVLTALVTTR